MFDPFSAISAATFALGFEYLAANYETLDEDFIALYFFENAQPVYRYLQIQIPKSNWQSGTLDMDGSGDEPPDEFYVEVIEVGPVPIEATQDAQGVGGAMTIENAPEPVVCEDTECELASGGPFHLDIVGFRADYAPEE